MPDLVVAEATIHYESIGEPNGRVPLLLTHGYSASTAMWAPNLPALSADRQIVVWDILGHGQSGSPTDPSFYSEASSVAAMVAILDSCNITKAAIGGLSLGGYLSLAFYLVHPERVAALLLFDTGPGFKNDEGRQKWNDYAGHTAVSFETKGIDALSKSPEVVPSGQSPVGLALAARGILTQKGPAVINSLTDISVPTLVLVGENDKPFINAADYMTAKIPGALKVVIPAAGHASNIDQPDAFNESVSSFLDKI